MSLCNLCVLCVSVVSFGYGSDNHRDTERTEIAQRRTSETRLVQLVKANIIDGIHMTEPYHRLMAKEWLKYLAGARGDKAEGTQ